MNKLFYITISLISILFFSCSTLFSTKNDLGFTVLKKANLSNLIPFMHRNDVDDCYYVYGIDTSSFSIKVTMVFNKEVSLGYIDKISNKGFVVSIPVYKQRYVNKLMIIDAYCNLEKILSTNYSPHGAKVFGGKIYLSHTYFNDNGSLPFQIFDLKTHSLLKEFGTKDMVAPSKMTLLNGKVYFGEEDIKTKKGDIICIDTTTLSTSEIKSDLKFFENAAFHVTGEDSLLYIIKIITREIGIYNLNQNKLTTSINTDTLNDFINKKMLFAKYPMIFKDKLYIIFFERNVTTKTMYYVAGFDKKTLSLKMLKKLDFITGGSFPIFTDAGSYFFVTLDTGYIQCYNKQTFELLHEIKLN